MPGANPQAHQNQLFLSSPHGVSSEVWLVWEYALRASFPTDIKREKSEKQLHFSVLSCHLPDSQVCTHPHKLEDCQHVDELFWRQSSLGVEEEEKSKCSKCLDPSFIPQESGGETRGARSDHLLASRFGWGCPLPLENKILKAGKGFQVEKRIEETDSRGMPTVFIKSAPRGRGKNAP